ncbi:hypothetical protein AKJ09_09482 [Labilithrix luteola]|uniref:Uncharacterized protein n=1 Tax=Labilithrix luteola TaxID=1391654 RepID=A0A0K1QAQ3_9BACT|nr:DUF6184 family natural product biosynthesis lipoprotein [Labilithrix luteola]AKV02819.1 hypothetical protein AKJ09_09482 [Labilithrix luteola]
MTSGSSVFAGVALTTVLLGACYPQGPGADQLLAASVAQRSDVTVATSRTIDNAGWVDNGGRTSDETIRTQLSGMRATELGSERITGTPGTGYPPLPPYHLPYAWPGAEYQFPGLPKEGPKLVPTLGAAPAEVAPRIAEAQCDREATCDHIGSGGRWESRDACLAQQRGIARDHFENAACNAGVNTTVLASCLAALRAGGCGDVTSNIDATPACRTTALCAQ